MRALNDVSFDLVAGQALAIVGESGSGKSTVTRILSLLFPKTAGSLLYDGKKTVTTEAARLSNTGKTCR